MAGWGVWAGWVAGLCVGFQGRDVWARSALCDVVWQSAGRGSGHMSSKLDVILHYVVFSTDTQDFIFEAGQVGLDYSANRLKLKRQATGAYNIQDGIIFEDIGKHTPEVFARAQIVRRGSYKLLYTIPQSLGIVSELNLRPVSAHCCHHA